MVDRRQPLNRFELYQHKVLHDEVEPVHSERALSIVQKHFAFALEPNTPMLQLNSQCVSIDGFQQPRPQMPMHFKSAVNDVRDNSFR